MIWVAVLGVAVIGLLALAAYGVSLAHKANDVMNEVSVVETRVGELRDLLGSVQLPPSARD